MTVTAELAGRDLHLTVEGVPDPFIVHPLPGRAGQQITLTYLDGSVGNATQQEIAEALVMALDGGHADGDVWVPVDVDARPNSDRIGLELSTSEMESVAIAAFFWQTVLGMTGVNAYLSGGEGVAGQVQALSALSARLGLSVPVTDAAASLEDLVQLQAGLPTSGRR